MDTFIEQIVPIKKTGKNITAICIIWFCALVVDTFLFLSYILGTLTFLAMAGVLYLAFRLMCKQNVEYEYIITNGAFDIDKIINKSERKRMASFEVSSVLRIEKFNEGLLTNVNKSDVVFACNGGADNTYLLVYQKNGKSPVYVVFAPNKKMKAAILKYLPKFIANSAFK